MTTSNAPKRPISLTCLHGDDGWTVSTEDLTPPVTTSARSRATAVRRAQRMIGEQLDVPSVDLTFMVSITAPAGVREMLAEAERQQAEARRTMATTLQGLLDDGWSLTDVAELANRSNAWVKQFLSQMRG